MSLAEALSWVACAVSLTSVYAYGPGKPRWLGPCVGLVSQFAWAGMALAAGLTGLLVSGAAFTALHLYNLYKASRKT